MIINENKCGYCFEEEEISWEVNNKAVSYDEVLKAVSEVKKVKEICVGNGDEYCFFETDELTWELSWYIRIGIYEKKYHIESYIHAIPYEYSDYLIEKEENEEDYEEVSQKMIAALVKDFPIVFADDVYTELEGDYVHGIKKEFDTLEEAFANIPVVFDFIYDYLNAKGRFVSSLAEYYEDKE